MINSKKYLKQFTKIEQKNEYTLYTEANTYLYIIRKRVSKRTIIHLEESGDIILEQLYPFGGMSRPSKVKTFILKPDIDKNIIIIVVYRGKPLLIKGLDENNFVSSNNRYDKGQILFIEKKDIKDVIYCLQ